MAGEQSVGIKDVAQLAGVAISSVSRVLAGHPGVSARMHESVMHAVQESGYEPDIVAQSLRRGRTMSVGFVVGDITNPLLSEIARAAQARLADDGYSLLLANSSSLADGDVRSIREFRRRRVDGLLLSLADETSDEVRHLVAHAATPAVLLDRDMDDLDVGKVTFDHRAGFTRATQHLLDLGHRHIGVLAGSALVRTTRSRVQAVADTMAAAGAPEPVTRLGTLSPQQGHDSALSLLDRADRPTAIICAGNQLLAGVLRATRTLSLTIPAQVSLVTTDGGDLAELHAPAICGVTRDFSDMGDQAAGVLVDMLHSRPARTIELPTDFRSRSSCGPARGR